MPSAVLKESQRTGEAVEIVTARKEVERRRTALEAVQQQGTSDPEMLDEFVAELTQAENRLQELLARDQHPPEPEDVPRA